MMFSKQRGRRNRPRRNPVIGKCGVCLHDRFATDAEIKRADETGKYVCSGCVPCD